MKQMILILAVVVFTAFSAGCQSQPEPKTPTPAGDDGAEEDDQESVEQEDEKVNENRNLGRSEDNGSDECPAPVESDQMCAQVITYALSPDGVCCEYPTPCHIPEELETFSTMEECEAAAESP